MVKKCTQCGNTFTLETDKCPSCGAEIKETSGRLLKGLIIVVIITVVLSFLTHETKKDRVPAQLTTTSKNGNLSPKQIALRKIQLDFDWAKGGFGNVMIADLTLHNPTHFDIKDITIECQHFGKSGTKIDSNTRTLYDIVPAMSTKVFKEFNMGVIHSQAYKSSCKVVDLVPY